MSYEQIVAFVRDLGFPIFVAGYLLFRMEHTLRELLVKIERLVSVVEQLCPPRS